MTNVKSADVSEEQLSQIKAYLGKNNLSTQQAYTLLLSRGMNATEAANLKGRLDDTDSDALSTAGNERPGTSETSGGGERRTSDTTNKTIQVANPKKIFGLEIFNNGVLSFEPNISIATPVGYIIGPNDEININIYGYQEAKYSLKVGPEGDINIPYVGVMYVAGLSIEQATAKIRS
ncbi:MAG: polysaccharide biosynthesis/export family protein, partial [Bacteroidota bacterium]|nr:polysaccharide biosynthesis/export family protein [Bacteroidota bacterium]